MAGKRHSAVQIINKPCEAEALLDEGLSVPEVGRRLGGVTAQTYYRWRKEYSRLRTGHAQEFQDLSKAIKKGCDAHSSDKRLALNWP